MNDWNYRCANWVYAVLSRVRRRKGLFLNKPLDLEFDFNVPETLIDFEDRVKTFVEEPLLKKLSANGHYDTDTDN